MNKNNGHVVPRLVAKFHGHVAVVSDAVKCSAVKSAGPSFKWTMTLDEAIAEKDAMYTVNASVPVAVRVIAISNTVKEIHLFDIIDPNVPVNVDEVTVSILR